MKHRTFALTISALALAAASFSASAADYVFSNTTPITKVGSGGATPYPSNINVAGISGNITEVTVTIHGFSHNMIDFPYLALVSAGGQQIMLFNGRQSGTQQSASNATWTFSMSGVAMPIVPDIPSGTYLPSNIYDGDNPPPPAPAGTYSTDLATLNGASATQLGTWSLYAANAPSETANLSISGGWSLNITTDAASTTCANSGYTGTQLLWCQNICEKGYTGKTLDSWIHRWIGRYRDLPYCAAGDDEGEGEGEGQT